MTWLLLLGLWCGVAAAFVLGVLLGAWWMEEWLTEQSRIIDITTPEQKPQRLDPLVKENLGMLATRERYRRIEAFVADDS